MSKPILFAGTRPYGRAENISALYDAYPGEKKILHVYGANSHHEIRERKGDILVIDDFPTHSPGRCIMIWHGIQGGKYIGFDQPNPYLTEERISVVDYEWLDKQLTDDEVFVVKAHVAGNKITEKRYEHIVEVSQDEPTTPYLYDCDVVITDYSSIIFDGYLLGKPAVLFEKKPGYVDVRGMYMKYPDEYCSFFATNESELIFNMRLARKLNQLGIAEKECVERVADMCDGHSCERIIKLIDELTL